MNNKLLYGQWKYSLQHKSLKIEWRILNYLESMRDWSDPEWIPIYSEAIKFYIQVLDAEIEAVSISARST